MSDHKILIAYYSRAGENYCSGQLRQLTVGNTEVAAKKIAGLTGGDLFHIEQQKPYAVSYNDCIEEARRDQRQEARPALVSIPDSLNDYDEIYLGYPNYWSTMPMAVFTFLESLDTAGRTIHPFCTHEGSGMGRSMQDLRRECPGAEITKGLAIHGSDVSRADSAIAEWVKNFQ